MSRSEVYFSDLPTDLRDLVTLKRRLIEAGYWPLDGKSLDVVTNDMIKFRFESEEEAEKVALAWHGRPNNYRKVKAILWNPNYVSGMRSSHRKEGQVHVSYIGPEDAEIDETTLAENCVEANLLGSVEVIIPSLDRNKQPRSKNKGDAYIYFAPGVPLPLERDFVNGNGIAFDIQLSRRHRFGFENTPSTFTRTTASSFSFYSTANSSGIVSVASVPIPACFVGHNGLHFVHVPPSPNAIGLYF